MIHHVIVAGLDPRSVLAGLVAGVLLTLGALWLWARRIPSGGP